MKVTKKVLKSLLKCVDEENIRYFLTGLYVDMGKKQITVTDGKILVRMEGVDVADPNTESKNPVIIEYKDVKALR